jgi:hypothetical protein
VVSGCRLSTCRYQRGAGLLFAIPPEHASPILAGPLRTAYPVPRPKGRIWQASEVAQLRVVSPAIDGPNLCLVIRFERDGEERFAHWLGGESWSSERSLGRLFAESQSDLDTGAETGMGPAPAETVALWVQAVATMGPDELESFEQRTFATWDRASLGDVRRAIERRRRELKG